MPTSAGYMEWKAVLPNTRPLQYLRDPTCSTYGITGMKFWAKYGKMEINEYLYYNDKRDRNLTRVFSYSNDVDIRPSKLQEKLHGDDYKWQYRRHMKKRRYKWDKPYFKCSLEVTQKRWAECDEARKARGGAPNPAQKLKMRRW